MNRTNVACEILKIEAHLSLTRAAMLQDDMNEYIKHLHEANKKMISLIENTCNFEMSHALVTK